MEGQVRQMTVTDVTESSMKNALDVIYKRVADAPGRMNALDVINAMRPTIEEPVVRDGIWTLVADGMLDLDTDLNLTPTGKQPD
jgi:hypothetical protein